MSVFERMSQIEQKLRNIELRFEPGGVQNLRPAPHPPGITSGPVRSGESVTFENLLHTLSEDQRFIPGRTRPQRPPGEWRGSPSDFDGFIREASQKYGVDESLIRAVIRQESGYDPNATSSVGAQGLMQLLPETAQALGVTDAYDPYQNIMGGTRYLKNLLDRFGGDLTQALAGYNAGPGAVEKYGGVPPYEETRHYVANVLEFYRRYKTAQGGSV